jgi:pyochelin biosynthetic protein PchC
MSLPPIGVPRLGNLPALDADIALFNAYRPEDIRALPCPVQASWGSEEASLSEEQVAAWAALSGDGFEMRQYPGDHFYLKHHAKALASLLIDRYR